MSDITSNLVLRADLQDNAASTVVVAQTGTNGSLVNAGNTSASSAVGPGVSLPLGLSTDGIDDKMNFGNQFSPGATQAFSLSAWVKCTSTTPAAVQLLIDKIQATSPFPGLTLFIHGAIADDPFDFVFAGSSHSIDVRFPSTLTNDWMHLVLTYDGSASAAGVAMYKNGVALTPTIVTNTLTSGDTTTHGNAMCLGERYAAGVSGPFAGSFSGFRVYTRVLSAEDVSALYALGTIAAPTITSDAASEVVEGSALAAVIEADDGGGTLTFSVTGGDDAALFSLDADTGELTFNDAPNYLRPSDANGDNIYDVDVLASNEAGADGQSLTVTVLNNSANDLRQLKRATKKKTLSDLLVYSERGTRDQVTFRHASGNTRNFNIGQTLRLSGSQYIPSATSACDAVLMQNLQDVPTGTDVPRVDVLVIGPAILIRDELEFESGADEDAQVAALASRRIVCQRHPSNEITGGE